MVRAVRVVLAVVVMLSWPSAHATTAADATRGARYLVSRQAPSGAFFTDGAPADVVAEALAVVAAAPIGDAAVDRALGYIRQHGARRSAERAAYAARITLGLLAAGEDPRDFNGDHVEQIENRYDPVKGTYDDGIFANGLAVLGLAAARADVPDRVFTMFETGGCRDGGFGHQHGCLSGADTDTTAVVLMALRRAGVESTSDMVRGARAWLLENQRDDGGFGARPGDPLNANSTGLAVSAIVALGEDPDDEPWQTAEGGTPRRALATLQMPSGGFRYVAGDNQPNDYATVQAVPALARRWYPIARWRAPETAGAGGRAAVTNEQGPLPAGVGRPARQEDGPSKAEAAARPPAGAMATAGSNAGVRGETHSDRPVAFAGLLLMGSSGLVAWRLRWSRAR